MTSRTMNIHHMKRSPIDSVDALVAAFGGTAHLAETLDVGMSTISNWKRAEDIPPAWHLRLLLEAQARAIDLRPDFFGKAGDIRPRHKGRRSRRKAKADVRPAA